MKHGTHRHWKVTRLMKALDVRRSTAVGMLQMLWEFVADFALEGDITHCQDEAAVAADWDKDTAFFINALVECRLADRDETSQITIHDWLENCEELVVKRLERKKLGSGRQRRTTADNGGQQPPTQPNPTQPIPSQPTPTAEVVVVGDEDLFRALRDRGIGEATASAWIRKRPPEDLRAILAYFDAEKKRGVIKDEIAALKSMMSKPEEKWNFTRNEAGVLVTSSAMKLPTTSNLKEEIRLNAEHLKERLK